jgi:hypothetical protein
MRFKVGDKVKIIQNPNRSMNNIVPDMEKHAGKVAVIKGIRMFGESSFYILDIDNGEWIWNECLVEALQFTKADLKPCMVVVRRDGSVCGIFQAGGILKMQENLKIVNCHLGAYKDDLTSFNGSKYDVMQVFDFADDRFDISTENRELLWERIEKSPQQIKLEELENKQREIADEIRKISEEM